MCFGLKSARRGQVALVMVCASFFAFLCWWAPLGSAVVFGDDEGFELSKGFMCSHGFSLYREIWNDQPPLHTLLLTTVFKLFGPSLLGARLLAVGFATVTVGSVFGLVFKSSGMQAALLAVLFLVSAPFFLILSVSAMLEMPAMGVALLAALLLFMWRDGRSQRWLFLSGVIMGGALQIKFTSGLLLPAFLVQLFLCGVGSGTRARTLDILRHTAIWLTGLALSFTIIGVACGESSAMLWNAHFLGCTHPEFGKPTDHRLSLLEFKNHAEAVMGTALALALILLRKQWRVMAFPLVFLGTSLTVHLCHCPYWDYYYLHLLLPMAWLSAHGISAALGWQPGAAFGHLGRVCRAMSLASAALILACLLGLGGARLAENLSFLSEQVLVKDDRLLSQIAKYREQTSWFFALDHNYIFHARLPVPPEILLIFPKRLWSGQLTKAAIVSCLQRYKPEQMVLEPGVETDPEWKGFIKDGYVPVYWDGEHVLFVAKRLVPDAPQEKHGM